MSGITIKGSGLEIPQQIKPANKGAADSNAGGFDTALREAFSKVNAIQQEADKAVDALAKGGDVNNAVMAMQKADMSFQLMVEVRNRLLTAYDEVMRMQV
ncbi:MAG: flagellar hook-basal body complex protein FliE [Nitrospirota bacterium]|uniref:Flagellar hook-basal body complex protein FliE n=1 Tax=Candidatus Magnetominusculus xianensis TaxID=1748249 RepID=A0ABR5SEV1_9BACT|nr:flagellar hook-basal body complex protein FliE [Candidatus Magnetominusculus xianensis]KWT85141.1 flagellar hook-basal body protein FliE [Candidatus Magnetominusculus xianensis]MBF0405399.1 flagellar hook-basal body complex protein FliE [Nitrospirota bacterium]